MVIMLPVGLQHRAVLIMIMWLCRMSRGGAKYTRCNRTGSDGVKPRSALPKVGACELPQVHAGDGGATKYNLLSVDAVGPYCSIHSRPLNWKIPGLS